MHLYDSVPFVNISFYLTLISTLSVLTVTSFFYQEKLYNCHDRFFPKILMMSYKDLDEQSHVALYLITALK